MNSPISRRPVLCAVAELVVTHGVQVKINGGAPTSGFYWGSADHNGVTGGCRSVLMYLVSGVRLSLYLEQGSTFSDSTSHLTSLSVFRLLIDQAAKKV